VLPAVLPAPAEAEAAVATLLAGTGEALISPVGPGWRP
jgi:hypothetical protein